MEDTISVFLEGQGHTRHLRTLGARDGREGELEERSGLVWPKRPLDP
jgi:hypothetical protein